MKETWFFIVILATIMVQNINAQNVNNTRICHSVVFKLRSSSGSVAEKEFLAALKKLSEIPGVENLQLSPEVSKKNKFEYHLSMEFADQSAYDRYNNHPDHVSFVQQLWMKEVEDFLEIDYLMEK